MQRKILMIRSLFFFLPFFLLANSPSQTHLNLFYKQAVNETRNALRGKLFESGFASQHFIIWDYCEDAPKQLTFAEHYGELYLFLIEEQIPKVILFPKNPETAGGSFFSLADQNISNENTFAYWLNLFAKAGIKIEILFEFDAFAHTTGKPTPTYSLPDPFYFQDLPQKMNWLNAMSQIVPGAILGVTIDPEAPGSGGNDGYQQVINYIDQYRFDPANKLSSLQSAMTFGIDGKPMTFANLDTFPIDSAYISPSPSTYFPANPLPTYRASTNQVPLLNNVYLQEYEPDFTLIFRDNLAPSTAVDTYIQALQDIPYKTSYGSITATAMEMTGTYVDGGQFVSSGKITCTMGSPNCTYTGTNFPNEIIAHSYLDYNDMGTIVPIGQISSDLDPDTGMFTLVDGANVSVDNETFILSQFGTEILSGATINTLSSYAPHPNMKIGAIDGPIIYGQMGYNRSLHQFNFLSTPTFSLSDQQFLGPEVVMKWIYPPITPAIAAGINFLFSVQYDISTGDLYFGNWSLANFMTFINQFTAQVSGNSPSNPIFQNSDGQGVALPIGNIGIYDYSLLLNTNTNPAQNTTPPAPPNPPPNPPNPWFIEFPAP